MFSWINRLLAFADLEMQLRLAHIAAVADRRDDVAPADLIAAPDLQGVGMGIGGDPTVRMLDQQQIPEPTQLVAGIDHNAVFSGLDRGANRCRDVQAVIVQPTLPRTETTDDPPL